MWDFYKTGIWMPLKLQSLTSEYANTIDVDSNNNNNNNNNNYDK